MASENDEHIVVPALDEESLLNPPVLLPVLPFPVVGIGASAGGLKAISEILDHLPSDTGMAFVVVQHLIPNSTTALPDLLAQHTQMPVQKIRDGMLVEANHVYTIPPNAILTIASGKFHLSPYESVAARYSPIDLFFRSLAEECRGQAIGVILSGSASDGTLGLRDIKTEGGITMAQEPQSAEYPSMPQTAISAGVVDFVRSLEGISTELVRLGQHPYRNLLEHSGTAAAFSDDDEAHFRSILQILRSVVGVDFTYYKQNTIRRRIWRRVMLSKFDRLAPYVNYLQSDTAEIESLYRDILINVTSFFRDPEVFEALRREIFPVIMKVRLPERNIRIWVPGCATGEEAYSIGMCLLEYMEREGLSLPVQIFATDVSEMAVSRARLGHYPESISLDVSPERLRRFFLRTQHGYQVNKTLRDMCVFAQQNVVADPPFSRLDLISCRNLLIYLGPALQRKVIPIFHYALSQNGFLLLGSSESVSGFSDLFEQIDPKHRIYAKRLTTINLNYDLSLDRDMSIQRSPVERYQPREHISDIDLQREFDRIVLARYGPAGLVVNDAMTILSFYGHIEPYLAPATGQASLNMLKMVRDSLLLELRTALREAHNENVPVIKQALHVPLGNQFRDIQIEVVPLRTPRLRERCYLIVFTDTTAAVAGHDTETAVADSAAVQAESDPLKLQVLRLQQELTDTREYLQAIIEDLESSNEDLKSANEEILSSNEELQSTNEELETAKEELQSSNEELRTLNEELINRNLKLDQVNDDLDNLLNSVNIPIVMFDRDLRIRQFTPPAERIFNLLPGDIGRPIGHIKSNITIDNLEQLIIRTIDSMRVTEQEVQDTAGHWYSLRLRPYKTRTNTIDGAVLVLIDIDPIKRSLQQVAEARDYAQAIVEALPDPLILLDDRLQVQAANRAFYQTFRVSAAETEGRLIYELGNDQWNNSQLRLLLEAVLTEHRLFQDLEIAHNFPRIGYRKMQLSACEIKLEQGGAQRILLRIEDVTKRRTDEQVLHTAEQQYEQFFTQAQDGLLLLDADSARITQVNPAALQLLGVAADALIGCLLMEIPALRAWKLPIDFPRQVRERGYVLSGPHPLETATGTTQLLEVLCVMSMVNAQLAIQCWFRALAQP